MRRHINEARELIVKAPEELEGVFRSNGWQLAVRDRNQDSRKQRPNGSGAEMGGLGSAHGMGQ